MISWIQGIVELIKFLSMLFNWWHEASSEKSKAKRDAISKAMEAADREDQDGIIRAINSFNSV